MGVVIVAAVMTGVLVVRVAFGWMWSVSVGLG